MFYNIRNNILFKLRVYFVAVTRRSVDACWLVQLTMSGPPGPRYRGPPSPGPFMRSPGGYRPYTPSPPPIVAAARRSMGSPCPLMPYIPCPTPRWPSPHPPGVPLPPGPRAYRMPMPVSTVLKGHTIYVPFTQVLHFTSSHWYLVYIVIDNPTFSFRGNVRLEVLWTQNRGITWTKKLTKVMDWYLEIYTQPVF